MMTNKPETALYRAPTFSLLPASHSGLVHVRELKEMMKREEPHLSCSIQEDAEARDGVLVNSHPLPTLRAQLQTGLWDMW